MNRIASRLFSTSAITPRAMLLARPSGTLSPSTRYTFNTTTTANSMRIRAFSAGPAPLEVPQIEERVLQLLRDNDKVSKDKLTLDAHFINDLGLDSLDQVEITMALEDEFNIEIPDKDAESIFTVREAVEKIFSNKNAI